MKLKTLKDIDVFKTESSMSILENYRMVLKQEAIKWVKDKRWVGQIAMVVAFKDFFDITKEDLK